MPTTYMLIISNHRFDISTRELYPTRSTTSLRRAAAAEGVRRASVELYPTDVSMQYASSAGVPSSGSRVSAAAQFNTVQPGASSITRQQFAAATEGSSALVCGGCVLVLIAYCRACFSSMEARAGGAEVLRHLPPDGQFWRQRRSAGQRHRCASRQVDAAAATAA